MSLGPSLHHLSHVHDAPGAAGDLPAGTGAGDAMGRLLKTHAAPALACMEDTHACAHGVDMGTEGILRRQPALAADDCKATDTRGVLERTGAPTRPSAPRLFHTCTCTRCRCAVFPVTSPTCTG